VNPRAEVAQDARRVTKHRGQTQGGKKGPAKKDLKRGVLQGPRWGISIKGNDGISTKTHFKRGKKNRRTEN